MALISPIYHVKDGPKKQSKPLKLDQAEPVSAAEKTFIRRAKTNGWQVLRAGWPDYMLIRKVKGKIEFQAVEVKQGHKGDPLRDSQRLMIASLVLQGIKVSIWSAESHTLRQVHIAEAQELLNRYFQAIESRKVKEGLRELRELGMNVRYDI